MFCHKCGRELNDDVSRCPFCNADTSAYLKDDDSSLREILRLSEELNEESDTATDSSGVEIDMDGEGFTEPLTQPLDTPINEEEEKQDDSVTEDLKEDVQQLRQEFDTSDGFYIPKVTAIKAGILPSEEEQTEVLQEETAELVDESQEEFQEEPEQQEDIQEIETIDAEEEPEEEEYVDETEEFISNYVPINEIPEEEPEEEREIDEDIDYEDGFVASYDDGFTDNSYKEEKVPEQEPYEEEFEEIEEEEPEKPKKKSGSKKRYVIIPVLIVIVAAAGWFGLSEFVINSSASEAMSAFADKKYDTAASIYNESVKNSPMQMWIFEGKMNSYIDEILNEHRDKVLSYDEAKIALNSVIALDDDRFTEKAKEALTTIEALEESRAAYATGQKYFTNGDYIAAAKEFDKVIESDPDYSKAVASRDRSYEKYKEDILSKTSGCETVDEYRAAIELLNEAVENLPNDTELKTRLDNCKKGLEEAVVSETVESANSLMDSGNYKDALSLIDETLKEYPDNSTLLNLKSSCTDSYISSSVSQAQQLVSSEKYMDAIDLMDSMLTQFPDNETLTNCRNECVNAYVSAAVSSADEFMEAGNYETALTVINKALNDLPDNSTLLNKKEEIETNMPVSLMEECPPTEGTNLKTFTNSSTSSFKIDGRTYREGFTLYSSNGWFASGNGVANMKIGGGYSRLTFNVGKVDGGKDVNGVLNVYVDNELVDTITISGDSGLQSFEIPLNYGSNLKFELSPESGSSTPTYGFTNLTLYK